MNESFRPASVWARVAVLSAVAVGLAACGFSADDSVTRIPSNELGALANTTTTSTTSTTLPPTSPPTSTPVSVALSTSTTSTTTTTLAPVETTPVDLFFAPRGDNESLRGVVFNQVGDVRLDDLVRLLSEPPAEVTQGNLTTAVTPGLVVSTEMLQLHTVVDLDPAEFEAMTDVNQNLAIAQLVLTLTSYFDPDNGPIGAVEFRVGGEPISVLIRGEGASDPGELVGYSHFRAWIDVASEPGGPPTSTLPDPPATTEPATPTSAIAG